MSVWFITGTSNGLGLVLALEALKAGHQVIASMRDPSRAHEAAQSIEEAGGRVVQLDSTESQQSIRQKMHEYEAIHGRIDVLVNNAGYSVLGATENFSEREILAQFQTNVFGPIFICQAVLPGMRARQSGTIINISSVAGQDAQPTCGIYAGSKFGLEGFTEALSKEVSPFGVSVFLVELGAFRTNFLGALVPGENGLGEAYEGSIVGQVFAKFRAAAGKQPGDPRKAARRIVELVGGQGEAGELRDKVLRLVLGNDARARIVAKTDKLRGDMELARDITASTDID